jgi:DNA-binding NarL/FixJ family response regulator
MSERKVRVLVVDDHPIVREGIRLLLSSKPSFEVCAEAEDWGGAMNEAARCQPDAVVLDISLGKRMGLDLIRELLSLMPKLRVLVLSMHDEMIYAERSLRAGAHGYVMKSDATRNVIKALERIMAGGMYVGERLEGVLLQRMVQGSGQVVRQGCEVLSNRELEVLSLIGTGLSTEAIAERLNLSIKTIEAHRSNIRSKLGLNPGERLLEVAIRHFATVQ